MIECLEHGEKVGRFSLASNGTDLVVLDVISYELILHHISINVHIVVACAVSNVLNTFVVVSGPEKWSVAIWDKLAKHIESCVRTLV